MNKRINNNNYDLNKDYFSTQINIRNIPSNIILNRNVNKNEPSNRKIIINIPPRNFLRASDYHQLSETNNFNEERISNNIDIKRKIQRNSLKNKSQSKKKNFEIKNNIFSPKNIVSQINYINGKRKNFNFNLYEDNEKIMMNSFQLNRLNPKKNPNMNNFQY